MSTDPRLAELLASRICHDLGSPVASITALLPQAADPAAHEILAETTVELGARLKLFSAAFGASDELAWGDLAPLLLGAPMAHRVRFEVAEAVGQLQPGRVRLLLAAALLAAEALPRGGAVRISRDPDGSVALLPEGRDAQWSPTLVRLLSGGSMEMAIAEGPRRVLAPWVVAQAAAEGAELGLALSAAIAMPPLLIGG
ncbi:histidine phosphotransferase family protein [Roseococcus sp. SYP-B2431]|uniref:histidine phosphotransferase family protein n=1 Tax=Roseococcus sp. SYP-B2431 TaxID=2496640 RepID=UPI0013F4310D|nr:histidine phosphotransferase family protein [Roseococcus sp. SYP-B2431]